MAKRSFGPKNKGPDLSWADEEIEDPSAHSGRALSPPSNVPGPTFPSRSYRNIIRTPKPLSTCEKRAVDAQLAFRRRCREGPLFTVLDRNSLLVDGVKRKSEEAKRRGFDPFSAQERYSTRHVKKARTEPHLGPTGRGDYGYTLSMFPEELWGILDPEQKLPDWKHLREDSPAWASLGKRTTKKSKRKKGALDFEKLDREGALAGNEEGQEDSSEDDDAVQQGGKRRKKDKKEPGQRSGMDAEDDIDAEQAADDAEDAEDNDEPEDSEFSEDEDAEDDYQAEQYFDAGEDDLDDYAEGGGGGDDY